MTNFTDTLKIARFCETLHYEPDFREVMGCLEDGETDFEVNNVRFISDETILEVLAEELSNDEYILGCFSSRFISDQTGVDRDVIDAMQKAEAFEAVGKLILSLCDMEAFAEAYVSADGYGHHFNHYDGNEEEITYNGTLYHVFDNH